MIKTLTRKTLYPKSINQNYLIQLGFNTENTEYVLWFIKKNGSFNTFSSKQSLSQKVWMFLKKYYFYNIVSVIWNHSRKL